LILLGLVIGSFLNCLIYRLNQEKNQLKNLLWGRSHCPKCRKQLRWYDNLPLISFIFLKGRCRFCHSPISWQYPLVEISATLLTLAVYLILYRNPTFNWWLLIFNLFLTYGLLAIFASDLRYRTIPDELVLTILGVVLFWLFFHQQWLNFLAGALAGGFFLFLVWITKGQGMGWGDVKLAGLMGLLLGFPKLVVAFYLAFLTGALVGVILVLTKRKKLNSQVPFGPFLTLATWISLFWGDKIWTWFL
ncbi:prepilin peptidase, partial [Candidatus Shapirobacteria bacterium]|nr:prepilin peptidase [Candidatus Shapirobacteria bacterium]